MMGELELNFYWGGVVLGTWNFVGCDIRLSPPPLIESDATGESGLRHFSIRTPR